MGRHFEVRAASMAATAAKKSAIYMRASKEIYMAAKNGTPDPNSNLALRSAIEKYRKSCPKDVIERAIKKAAGGEQETYIAGRYEAYGPGNCYVIVDTLTDNVNRALTDVRTAITKKGGHMGTVSYNFEHVGIFGFEGTAELRDTIEETLILNDVDVREVSYEDNYIEVIVAPESFSLARDQIAECGVKEFDTAELTMLPNEKITLTGEDLEKFNQMLDMLDDVQDVQEVYHNVER